MKWEWIVTFSRYTESWRLARKLLDRSLRPAVIASYRPLLQTKAHVLLTQLLANPDELEAHLYQFVAFFWCRRIVSTPQHDGIVNVSLGVRI
jgi:cytochrome P450